MIREAYEVARADLLEASDCLQAFVRGERGVDADVGGLLVAEFFASIRSVLGVR